MTNYLRNLRCCGGQVGASVVEYIVLIIIIISAFLIMQQVIQNGIFAKHKQAGEAFGFGRQYDGKRTTVCKHDILSYDKDGNPVMGPWYDEDCYEARVRRPGGCPPCDPGDTACFVCEDAIKNSCVNEYCKQ